MRDMLTSSWGIPSIRASMSAREHRWTPFTPTSASARGWSASTPRMVGTSTMAFSPLTPSRNWKWSHLLVSVGVPKPQTSRRVHSFPRYMSAWIPLRCG